MAAALRIATVRSMSKRRCFASAADGVKVTLAYVKLRPSLKPGSVASARIRSHNLTATTFPSRARGESGAT